MAQNSLEKGIGDEIINDIIKRASDLESPMDERDRELNVKTLNEKLSELRRTIEKLNGQISKSDEKRRSLDEKIDEADDDKLEADKKIQKLENKITADGIDKKDTSNPIVRRLNSVISERESLEELSNLYAKEGEGIDSDKKEAEEKIEKLKEWIVEVEKAKEDINAKMQKAKEDEAVRHAKDKAKGNTSREDDPLLLLLDSFIKRNENIRERSRLVAEAQKTEMNNEEKLEARYSSQPIGDSTIKTIKENEEQTAPISDDNNDLPCVSLVVMGKDGYKVKILTVDEYEKYAKSEEGIKISEAVKSEKDMSDKEKTVSVVVARHDSKERLIRKLEPIIKAADFNPQDIGQYANSETRRTKLLETIAFDSEDFEKMGGSGLNIFFDKKEKMAESMQTKEAREEQPYMGIQSTIPSSDSEDKMINGKDIPWSQLKEFGFSKNHLHKDDIDALRRGRLTRLLHLTGTKKNGEQVKQDFKLTLSTDENGNLKFRRLPVLSIKNVDRRKKLGDIEFTDHDKMILKKYGQLNHLVPFTTADGATKNWMVGLEKDTNTIFIGNPDKIRIPKFLKEQCTEEQLKMIKNATPVHLENLKDDAGQDFSGWVVMSPHRNGSLLRLNHIDKEFVAQVRNNNFGERTDELKQDKDAKVMSGQTKSNDPAPNEKTRKPLDYSEEKEVEDISRGMKMK